MEYFNHYSDEYINALKLGNGEYKIRLELLSDGETVVGEITQDLSLSSAGQITINYEQIVRRSCSLTLINVDNKYHPNKNSPFWINRKFKLWLGLVVNDNIYWWSQGVFYTLSATSTNNELNIEAVDKGAALDGTLKLNMTEYDYEINRGDTVCNAVRSILSLNMNDVDLPKEIIYSNGKPIDSATPIVGIEYYTQTLQNQIHVDANNYISEILLNLANSYAADCYYDTDGHFVFSRYIESSGYQFAPKIWDFDNLSSFFEDVNYDYSYDGENVVTYYTNSSDETTTNVAWTAYNTNPLSPLCVTTGIRRAPSQEMEYYRYYGQEEIDECLLNVKEIQDEILERNVDVTQVVYGNIDMDNRQPIEWNDENLETYANEIESWGYEPEELEGSVSTVMGMSSEYDGVEIAFSPLLQAVGGAVLLSEDTVNSYIFGLINSLGVGWTKETLIAADVNGLTIDGVLINKIIADAGDTAIATGENMHYVGQYGALAMAKAELAGTEAYYDHLNAQQMIANCRSAANHYLVMNSLVGMQLTFNCPIIPHIDVNKTIGINDTNAGIDNETFVIQSVTIPLSADKMSINATNISWLPNDMGFDGKSELLERS